MKKMKRKNSCCSSVIAFFLMGCFALIGSLPGQEDMENSRDHSLFSRMSNFYIEHYEKNFDLVEFSYTVNDEEKEMTVEGNMTRIAYQIKDDVTPPSPYQIVKNHVDAVKGPNVEFLEKSRDKAVMKILKDNREAWVILQVYNGGESYGLTVVQVGEMQQEVTAGNLLQELEKRGRVAIYIHFATNSADLDGKSAPVIAEIVSLLRENPALKLTIEGHTDSSGDAEKNLKLSAARANSVMNALVNAGISGQRLAAKGFGAAHPVADNGSEEGRARNRRVELVDTQA